MKGLLSSNFKLLLLFGVIVGELSTTSCLGPLSAKKSGSKSTSLNDTSLARIRKRGTVRIGVKSDVPYFGYTDPITNKREGFDIEMAKLIAKALFPNNTKSADEIEYIDVLSKDREDSLVSSKVDLIISTYSMTPQRAKIVDFVGPYYVAGQDLLVRKYPLKSQITNISGLANRRVCSATGSTSIAVLEKLAPKSTKIVAKDQYSQCFRELMTQGVDAISTDDVILLGLAANHPELAITGNPFHAETYGVGVKKGEHLLAGLVHECLSKAITNRDWERAFVSTFGRTGAISPLPPQLDKAP